MSIGEERKAVGSQSTSLHTPGPWEAISTIVRTCRKENGSGGLEIAACSLLWPERAANARMIAAAPDLLEALKIAQLRLETVDGNDESAIAVRLLIGDALAKAVQS